MNEILVNCFNDWANGVAIDDTHIFEESLDHSYFVCAYNKMLEKVTSNYPNADGMNTLATLVIKEMAPNEAKGFMNC